MTARNEYTTSYFIEKGTLLQWSFRVQERDIGFGERLLFHSMWPIVSGRIYARMRREHQKQAARLLLRRRGLDERVLERVEAALGEEPIEPLDPEELRRAVDAKGG